MKFNLKNIIKRIIYPTKYSSDAYIKHLRGGGKNRQ